MAGIATGGRAPERVQASTYALDVVKGYFLSRGRELRMGDPAAVLERILDYISAKLHQQSRSKDREFLTDLNLFACTKDRLCVVGTGGATVFVSHQGAAKKVMGHDSPLDLLGRGEALRLPRLDSPVWAGDKIVFLSPPLGEVFGSREISLVLHKVSDPDKAALLFNSLAARKEVEGELVTLIWEVPLPEMREFSSESALVQAEPPEAESYAAEAVETELAGEDLEATVEGTPAETVEEPDTAAPAAGILADLIPMGETPVEAGELEMVMEAGERETAEEAGDEAPPLEDEATTVKKSWLKRFGHNKIDLSP